METGLDGLLRAVPADLAAARVGLLTHAGGVGHRGAGTADLLAACPDLRLVRLFAPEHGLRGDRPAGVAIADGIDAPTGLPVVSLYGRGSDAPRLDDLDAILVDLQDIGCRYFTYPATMRRLIGRAATAGVPVWVLDRPNPLGGEGAGAVGVPAALRSLVGAFDVPMRHGLTIGELALLAAGEEGLPEGAVRVLAVGGWRRTDAFPAWGRPWVPPSPNSTGPEMAELYPGTCLVEGTNLSEGRGTPYPFRQIGAPWIDGAALSRQLAPLLPPGIWARPVWFLPTASKHAGTVCQGVFFDLDPRVTRSADAGLVATVHLLALVAEHPRLELIAHAGVHWLDRLTGSAALRESLGTLGVADILAGWRRDAAAFDRQRPIDLYPG